MKTPSSTPNENTGKDEETPQQKGLAEQCGHIYVSEANALPLEMERSWKQHIFHYGKDAGETIVYDTIGRPCFIKAEELQQEEFSEHLTALLSLMYNKGISLHFDEEENREAIYRFVTEEMFYFSVNNYVGLEGEGHQVFDYYDYHPNHYKDLERSANEYLQSLFKKQEWEGQFLDYSHHKEVCVNGKTVSLSEYSVKMSAFKKRNPVESMGHFHVESIQIEIEKNKAHVSGTVEMKGVSSFPFRIGLLYDFYWCISELDFLLVS